MAKRLIDGNSFVIEELLERDKTEYLDTFVDGVRATVKAIRAAQTEDAVEVVRCKDCKWDKPDKLLCKHWCTRFIGCMEMREDDFCSYGERKEG